MQYFSMVQDDRLSGELVFASSKGKGLLGDQKLETPAALYVQGGARAEYSDYLERPYPLISDAMYRITKKYWPVPELGMVALIDEATRKQRIYWSLELEPSDCISVTSEQDKLGLVRTLVLDESRIPPVPLFQVVFLRQVFVVVRLDLAESMLRREMFGFRLIAIDTIRKDEV